MKYKPLYTQIVFILSIVLLATLTVFKYMEIDGWQCAPIIIIPLTILAFFFALLYFYLVKKYKQ